MWDLPGPGLELMFPTLAGGFLTTVPPGKPQVCFEDIKMGLTSPKDSKLIEFSKYIYVDNPMPVD